MHHFPSSRQGLLFSVFSPRLADFFTQIRIRAGDLIGKENPRGHSREDEDPEREELEVPDQDATHLGVGQVLARQEPLGDDLKECISSKWQRKCQMRGKYATQF